MNIPKPTGYLFFLLAFGLFSHHGSHSTADIVTDWVGYSPETAIGNLNGIDITGTRIGGAEFANVASGAFSTIGGKWSAGMELSADAEAIIVQPVNAGADHQFDFSSPMTEVLFYVSNFDSSSDANLTVEGAESIEMITGSSTMFYEFSSASSGRLFTTNNGFDGNADAVLRLTGNVQSVRMQYTNGIQNNGIGYTFVSVPEPGSLTLLMSPLMMVALGRRRIARHAN